MIFIILLTASSATVLCFACLVQGAKADEASEKQYEIFLKSREQKLIP